MSEGRKTLYILLILQTFILTFAVVIGHSLGKAQTRESADASTQTHFAMIRQAMNYIENKYREEDVDEGKLVFGAIKGMTEALQEAYDDPYSQFLPTDIYEETMEDTKGKYGGLGIEISTTIVNGYPRLTVISILSEDTPAYKAGLEAGDHIIKINGEPIFGISLAGARRELRGEPNTKVMVTVARAGEDDPIDIAITRSLIKAPTVKSRILAGDIGYIRISQFSDTTPENVDEALDAFEKARVKGVILDLRSNPGGTLSAAVEVASDFLREEQLVVYTEGRGGEDRREFHVRKGAPHPWHPLVVLVNQWSASGSEIMVGAIKDHKRGIIIGDEFPTFGKGSVQTIFPMQDGKTGLKLTVAYYYTPSGKNINKVGIESDIKYPASTLTPSEAKIFRKLNTGESLDEFVKEAGDDILSRLKRNARKDEEDPDRELFKSFVEKLSQEGVILSEDLIKLAIARKTKDEVDEYEYDPAIRFAINHLRALDVLDVLSNQSTY